MASSGTPQRVTTIGATGATPASASASASASATPVAGAVAIALPPLDLGAPALAAGPSAQAKSTVKRCGLAGGCCRVKLSLVDRERVCRCGGVFCAAHRASDDHACTFDYRAAAQATLSAANVRVVASKLGDPV